MGQVHHSGAFLQQCWSVHPLCVAVKRISEGNRLILSCTSCRFVHYLMMSSVVIRAAAVLGDSGDTSDGHSAEGSGQGQLEGCLATHASALSLRQMDVFEDQALVRCAECRRHYAVSVSSFETHQK